MAFRPVDQNFSFNFCTYSSVVTHYLLNALFQIKQIFKKGIPGELICKIDQCDIYWQDFKTLDLNITTSEAKKITKYNEIPHFQSGWLNDKVPIELVFITNVFLKMFLNIKTTCN